MTRHRAIAQRATADGWEDRIRTYVTGSRIQGPAARRLPITCINLIPLFIAKTIFFARSKERTGGFIVAFFHSFGMILESFLYKLLGLICLITGIFGLFFPIIPGVALIVIGLGLLGCKPAVRWGKKSWLWVKRYFKNKKHH
jgi:hypothetical protein